MRWILTAVCVVAVCVGCNSSPHRSGPSSACAARIMWNGRLYYGETFARLPPATLMLGTGGRPTCLDTNGGEAGASSTVEVRRMIGVDPRVGVAVEGEPEHAYLAVGYFVQLPSHPLHAGIEWTPRSLNELTGCAATRPLNIRVMVGSTNLATLTVPFDGRDTPLFVDAYTRIQGLERNGLPYVAPGQRVDVRAVECLSPDGRLRKIVPRRIAPA